MSSTDVSTDTLNAVIIYIKPARGIPTEKGRGLGILYRDELLEIARKDPITVAFAKGEFREHWEYIARSLLRARDQMGAERFAVWSSVIPQLAPSEVAPLVAYAEKDQEDRRRCDQAEKARRAESEAWRRAAGNRSRIVIDTTIKIGDRVRLRAIHPMLEKITPAVGRTAGKGYSAQALYLSPSFEEVEARVLGFPGTVTDIYYRGAFEGFICAKIGGEAYPAFNKRTKVSVECDLDGQVRRGHLDRVVPL